MNLKPIQIYDTTLRDGTQGEGVSFSLHDKLQISQRLDEIGVDYVEGGYPLGGSIRISGAKNAALPLMAATILAPGTHVLHNVPDLRDTRTMLALLESFGVTWERRQDDDALLIHS